MAEAITIVGSGTRLTSDASRGDGPGGNLILQAQNITVGDKASVTAATGGKGDAGSIAMTAQNTLLLQSGGTVSTSTRGAGKGGTILINANQLILDGPGTSIIADTLRPFADLGVTLEILHTNDGDLVAQLDSPAGTRVALFSRVGGNGDNFTGTTLDDQSATPITGGKSPFTGTFQPREPLAQLIDQPATGTWTLNIRDSATGNTGQLKNWSIRIGDQVFQSANVPATIPDNGVLQSAVTVAGPAGARVTGIGEVPGIGGDITIQAGAVTIQNGATLSATNRGSGKGGTLHVNATGPVILTGANSGLFTDAEASGPGGSINVHAARVDLTSGTTVSAASSGTGNAGNISITAADQLVMTDSSVTTEAGLADGGNISLRADNLIHLTNTTISSSVGNPDLTTTTGGNIFIDPQFVILKNSKILANAFAGTGGNINIVAGVLLLDPLSIIDASSAKGVSGTITIQSPLSNLSGTLAPLPQTFLRTGALLSSRCVARLGGPASSFVVAGRDAIPMEPGGLLPSPLARARTAPVRRGVERCGHGLARYGPVRRAYDRPGSGMWLVSRHRQSRRMIGSASLGRLLVIAAAHLVLIHHGGALAQVTPPLTSSGLNTQVSAPTPVTGGKTQYDITGGTRPNSGPNLFHSFGKFDVPTNNIANFLNDTNIPTTNILSRVTGGNPSNIFGTIQTTGFPGAHLFLDESCRRRLRPHGAAECRGLLSRHHGGLFANDGWRQISRRHKQSQHIIRRARSGVRVFERQSGAHRRRGQLLDGCQRENAFLDRR